MKPRLLVSIAAALFVLAAVIFSGNNPSSPAAAEEPTLPIVFVHGGAGSGAQYETQAMRFASNGYPNVVRAIDRTSSTPSTLNPMLDAFFDGVMAETGDDQIYVAAHSLGTSLMVNYLNSSPERSARVAKYINIDGATGANCPGNPAPVNCMGVWGQGNPARAMGANNVYFPNFGHTQTVTAAESFGVQYEFLTGAPPATTLVVPEDPEEVEISGKLINFPANTGMAGAVLNVWEVNGATGHRISGVPVATYAIGASGEFGPLAVNGQRYYEFEAVRTDVDYTGHIYYQPFIRDDHLIRLLASPPGAATVTNAPRSPDHLNAVLIRYKEWWSDQGAGNNDTMWTTTNSPAWNDHPETPSPGTQNILSHPGVGVRASNEIGFHITDWNADKVSSLEPIPLFVNMIFQTGADVWMPATEPPDGTVSFVSEPRGDTTNPQVVNIPNWASSLHRIGVQFNDYAQQQCLGQVATIVGTLGNDVLTGTDGPDVIVAKSGNDIINGADGDDIICAEDGNDTVEGGDGNDTIDAGNGDDTVNGGNGNDSIHGRDGNDALDGGNGNDDLSGADGNDVITAGNGDDSASGGGGNDTVSGQNGEDNLDGGGGTDNCNGGSGTDTAANCEVQASIP
jgi:pimeloyl-ACP methyl ester carboxylesterase